MKLRIGVLFFMCHERIGTTEAKQVQFTTRRTVPEVLTIGLADSNGRVVETITATPNHPFYVHRVGFVPAGRLAIGNSIVTRAGPALIVKSIEKHAGPEGYVVYNFEVEDDHTYFVGRADGGIWVHNPVDCFGSTDPGVSELARKIEERYPGHVVGVNQIIDGHEVDIQLRNALIEYKKGGSGLARQVQARAGNSLGLPVFGYSPKLGYHAMRSINATAGIAAGGKASTLEEFLRVIKP